MPETALLKEQKLTVLQFSKLEAQDGGAGIGSFWWELYFWLVDSGLLAVSSQVRKKEEERASSPVSTLRTSWISS